MNKKCIQTIQLKFTEKFSKKPLLIFSPGRINLIGEHTDYNNGFVFPAATDKGMYAAIEKSESNFSTVVALDMDEQFEFNLNNLKPLENGSWKNYILGVVFEIQKKEKVIGNFNIVFKGDIPSGAGLSSSAALENSIVFGLNELFNLKLTKQEMIFISQKAEHNFVGVKCGIMDQFASMFGKENEAILLDCKNLDTEYFQIDFKEYDILLINTNVKHSLSESEYNERRAVCEKIANLLKVDSLREISFQDLETIKDKVLLEEYKKATYILEENKRVIDASKALKNQDLISFGKLLYESHSGLQHQYKVSCTELDFLIENAKENKNILGARMMGGGFGGCTINIIKKEAIKEFSSYIEKEFNKKFNFNCSCYSVKLSKGTHVIEV
ncbi:MAG: galactokinase [Flavobacteriaceae bacterium]